MKLGSSSWKCSAQPTRRSHGFGSALPSLSWMVVVRRLAWLKSLRSAVMKASPWACRGGLLARLPGLPGREVHGTMTSNQLLARREVKKRWYSTPKRYGILDIAVFFFTLPPRPREFSQPCVVRQCSWIVRVRRAIYGHWVYLSPSW